MGDQLDKGERSYQALRTSVESLLSGVSAAELTEAGTALSALGSDAHTLIRDIHSSC